MSVLYKMFFTIKRPILVKLITYDKPIRVTLVRIILFSRYISHFTRSTSIVWQWKFVLQGILDSSHAFQLQRHETPTTISPCIKSSDNEYAIMILKNVYHLRIQSGTTGSIFIIFRNLFPQLANDLNIVVSYIGIT